MTPYGLHWFRRDLRVAGNSALKWSWREHSGRVLGVFFLDSAILSRDDFSPDRFGFFLATLQELKKELRELGGDLLVLDGGPHQGFNTLFETLKKRGLELPKSVSFNRDYEPFARARDEAVGTLLEREWGLKVHTDRDHLLIEPAELSKDGRPGSFYQVYSPFAKKWFASIPRTVQPRIDQQKEGLKLLRLRARGETPEKIFSLTWGRLLSKDFAKLEDCLDRYQEKNRKHVTIELPEAGSLAAFRRLEHFKKHLEEYAEKRDVPAEDGTSKLSIYFKNGSLVPAQAIAALGIERPAYAQETGPTRYLKEIVWREFYYHILFHRPDVERQSFLEKYRHLKWENRDDLFEAWKEGRTGYPIVDAGMRQLKTTGWMHNRLRMIVASFLTKDLLIDWRWGEKWFMQRLLDGDLAPNNGGWQWAASTGCDPQPYFRIFNPDLQAKRFDPDGEYIRRYVPEVDSQNYPDPVVVHASRKLKALMLYR